MKRTIAAFALVATLCIPATSVPAVASAPFSMVDPYGVLRYSFRSRAKPTLNCPVLHVCDVVLEPGEVVRGVAIGDSVRWKRDVDTSGDPPTAHVLVKPTQAGLSTNMVIDTNRRTYYVDLVSSKNGSATRIGFYNYYDPALVNAALAAATASAAQPTPIPELPVMDVANFHYGYRTVGNQPFRPIRAYNDGQHTFIELPASIAEAPVAKSINAAGGFETVNYRVKDVVVVAINGVPHVFEQRGDGLDPEMEAAIKNLGDGTALQQKEKLYVIDGVPDKIALFLGEGRGRQQVTVIHNG